MARAAKPVEDFSTPLEEYVPCPFFVVGTPAWIQRSFEQGALFPNEIIPINCDEDLQFFKDFLLKTLDRYIDTETTGPKKDDEDDKNYNMNPLNEDTWMVVLQVSDGNITYIVEPDLIPKFKNELEADSCYNTLHNAAYDWRWLFVKYGVHLQNIYCTMLAEQVSTAGLSGFRVNLQDTARRHYPHYLISKAVRSMFISYKGFMTRKMVHYGARDCVLLGPLKQTQIQNLNKYNLYPTAQLEFDIIPCTAELELDGILLDVEKIKIIIAYWLKQKEEKGAAILDVYDSELKRLGKNSNFLFDDLTDVFDMMSNKDKLKVLGEMGFELEDVKRETLKQVDHDLAKKLAEYSGIIKKTSTYGQNMLDKINQWTGKWQPKFNQLGSGEFQSKGKDNKDTIATGRFSGDGQQFPKPVELYCKATDEEYNLLIKLFEDQIETARTTRL